MADKNFIILEGTIIKKPQLKISKKGKQYCNFYLRSTISKKINNGWDCEPSIFPVRIRNNTAHWHSILEKNMYILIMGRLHKENGLIYVLGDRFKYS